MPEARGPKTVKTQSGEILPETVAQAIVEILKKLKQKNHITFRRFVQCCRDHQSVMDRESWSHLKEDHLVQSDWSLHDPPTIHPAVRDIVLACVTGNGHAMHVRNLPGQSS